MIQFETGRVYRGGSVSFEVLSRTKKMVTFERIYRLGEQKETRAGISERRKVFKCGYENLHEAFRCGGDLIEATEVE